MLHGPSYGTDAQVSCCQLGLVFQCKIPANFLDTSQRGCNSSTKILDQRQVSENPCSKFTCIAINRHCNDETKSDYSLNWMVHSDEDSLRIHSYAVTQIFQV